MNHIARAVLNKHIGFFDALDDLCSIKYKQQWDEKGGHDGEGTWIDGGRCIWVAEACELFDCTEDELKEIVNNCQNGADIIWHAEKHFTVRSVDDYEEFGWLEGTENAR